MRRGIACVLLLSVGAVLAGAGSGMVRAGQDPVPAPATAGPPAPPTVTQPATRPAALPADQLLTQMLRPGDAAARPLLPQPQDDIVDVTTGPGAVAPDAQEIPLLREGSFIVDRTGRLSRPATGNAPGAGVGGDGAAVGGAPTAAGVGEGAVGGWGLTEFVFEADGRTLRDPPLLVLPNRMLQAMEDAQRRADHELRFRITGMVTEYRGRNAILIERAVVVTH